MKKVSARDKANTTTKLDNYRTAHEQALLDLFNDAHAAEEADGYPQSLRPDAIHDGWFRRMSANSDLIQNRGGFSSHVATLAMINPDWETKETVAEWLRQELKLLRDTEAKAGAPVRRGKAMSRTAIADIAIELLTSVVGDSLTCLFQELLDVDRHRRSVAEAFVQLDLAAQAQATLELQGVKLGVRDFAKMISVSPSTVTRWRRSSSFHERLKHHSEVWRSFLEIEYADAIPKELSSTEGKWFKRAFRLYAETLPERRAGRYRSNFFAGASPVQPQPEPKSRARISRKNTQAKSKR